MAVNVINECTVARQDDCPLIWICFDQRIYGVAADAAGDCYSLLQQEARLIRLKSNGKYTVDLRDVTDGIIKVTDNLAIANKIPFADTIDHLTKIIASARAV